MPAKGPVTIPWQVVFMFITPLNVWVFYRIKNLTKAAIYVFIPSTLSQIPVYYDAIDLWLNPTTRMPFVTESGDWLDRNPVLDILEIIPIAFLFFAIYLVYKWSKYWNNNFQKGINDDGYGADPSENT